MGIYEGWFYQNVEQRLMKIADTNERLNLLYDEKRMFVRNNSGDEAQRVISEFDILIEKEVAMQQILPPPTRGNNDVNNGDDDLHPRYFKKGKFELFENLVKIMVREKYELADYSFIFRRMQKDKFIYIDILESGFRKWLFETYGISIPDPLKILENCSTKAKELAYSGLIR